MALDFPTSPVLNQTVTISDKTWKYNGKGWKLVPNQVQGLQGVQGRANQGVQGLAGSIQGTQGGQGVQGLSNQGTQGLQGNGGTQGLAGAGGISGITIWDANQIVGTSITTVNFTGSGISSVTAAAGIATVKVPSPLTVVLYGGNAAAFTNMPAAITFFLGATGNPIVELDLSHYNQGRLLVNKTTVAGAGANTALLIRYSTTFTQTAGSYLTMGTSEIQAVVGTNASGHFDSGWINLVAGAKADGIFVGLFGINGNGTADPQFGTVVAQFR